MNVFEYIKQIETLEEMAVFLGHKFSGYSNHPEDGHFCTNCSTFGTHHMLTHITTETDYHCEDCEFEGGKTVLEWLQNTMEVEE